MKQKQFKKGDLVRIVQSSGSLSEDRWIITGLGPQGFACTLQPWGKIAPHGKKWADQHFDTSMLKVDNSGPRRLAAMLPRIG